MDATVSHCRLLVDDYATCYRFYRDVLGLEATFGDAESGYADFDTGDVTLALFDASEMAAAVGSDPDAARGRDTAMVIVGVDDVDDAYHEVADAALEYDATAVAGPTDHADWGIRTAHVRDPDGTLVELNEPLER